MGAVLFGVLLTIICAGLAILTLDTLWGMPEYEYTIGADWLLTRVTGKTESQGIERVRKGLIYKNEPKTHYYIKFGFNEPNITEVDEQDYKEVSIGGLCVIGVINTEYFYVHKIDSIVGSEDYDINHSYTVGVIEDKYELRDRNFIKVKGIEDPIELYSNEEEDLSIDDSIVLDNNWKDIIATVKIDRQDIEGDKI